MIKASTALIRAKQKQISGIRSNGDGGYCAIGILDKVAYQKGSRSARYYFNISEDETIKCPSCKASGELFDVICHLNNSSIENHFEKENGFHGWNFKQIGHWLKDLGY